MAEYFPTVEAAVDVYDDGVLRVEHDKYYVECQGKPIDTLTRSEFLLLSRLARDAGRPVAYKDLWAAMRGPNAE